MPKWHWLSKIKYRVALNLGKVLGSVSLALLLLSPAANARVTYVDPPSGLQPAIEAAAEGDTLILRSGMFKARFQRVGGWHNGWIEKQKLTIMAEVPGASTIGDNNPTPDPQVFGQTIGLRIPDGWGMNEIRVIGVRFSHQWLAIFSESAKITLEDCELIGDSLSSYSTRAMIAQGGAGARTTLRRCIISGFQQGISLGSELGSHANFLAIDTVFGDETGRPVSGFNLEAVADAHFEDCTFAGFTGGLVDQGTVAQFRNCQFLGEGGGLEAHGQSSISLDQCQFTRKTVANIHTSNALEVLIQDCYFGGGENWYTLGVSGAVDRFEMSNSTILNAGSPSLRAPIRISTGAFVDLSNNWWGTTDIQQIDDWIYDNEELTEEFMDIPYLPILQAEPVPTKRQSVGGLKAGFGN